MSNKTTDKSVVKCLGFCGFGMGSNITEVDVKDGRVARIRPLHYDQLYTPEELNAWKIEARGHVLEPGMKSYPPPLSVAYKTRTYSPNRIPYPLKRVDWDPNGERNTQNRGSSKYVHISWDKACDLIAAEIKRIQEEAGPFSILAQSDGHGETKNVHAAHGCQTNLLNLTGGFLKQARQPDSWEELVLGRQARLGHGPSRHADHHHERDQGHLRQRRRHLLLGRRPRDHAVGLGRSRWPAACATGSTR